MKLFAITLLCIASALAGPVQNHNAMKITPLKDIGSRIIGGNRAQLGQFPYQVAVIFTKGSRFFCGGSLISPEWVLTAAHCCDGATLFELSFGTVNLYSAEDFQYANEYVIHEDWNPNTKENDVGLIHLTRSVQLSDNIATIKLASSGDYLVGDAAVTVSGWGITSDGSNSVSDVLNYVDLKTLTNSQCEEYFPGFVGDGMVCTDGSNYKSSCSGDTGGPLVTGSGWSATHVGIVSWASSEGCAIGYPAGFTRTAAYSTWVSSKTGI